MAVAGKVSLRPRGRFDITVTYERLDFVKYNTGCYVALQTTTGNLPTDTTNFMNMIDFDIANMSQIGLVKPDGESTTIDSDGTLHAHAVGNVLSFNGRTGEVFPQTSDYTAAQVAYDNTDSSLPATNVKSAIDQLSTAVAKCECLVLSTGNTQVSALPYDFTNSAIETDMVCINSVLGNPSAQVSEEWEVNTDTAGRARVSGTISGSTTITLYLMKSR